MRAAALQTRVQAGWLQPRFRWRLALLFFLMAHAGLTELVQTYVPGRTGKVPDVVLDHAGILVGLAVSWRWWGKGPIYTPRGQN